MSTYTHYAASAMEREADAATSDPAAAPAANLTTAKPLREPAGTPDDFLTEAKACIKCGQDALCDALATMRRRDVARTGGILRHGLRLLDLINEDAEVTPAEFAFDLELWLGNVLPILRYASAGMPEDKRDAHGRMVDRLTALAQRLARRTRRH